MDKEPTCRIPLRATYVIENGEAVMVDAEWADVPARAIAEKLRPLMEQEEVKIGSVQRSGRSS